MHSYKPESETAVALPWLLLISVAFPISQFILCSIFSNQTLSSTRKLWDIFIGLMVLCGSMSVQLMIVCTLKNICGLPRPDLISRCEPDFNIDIPQGQLSTIDICTTSNLLHLQEAFRTFPSGHSSTVFCGMVLSSLNISAKLQVFDQRGISFKTLLAIIPIMIACFVSCTRISDNRHFLRDVIGGLLIGILTAIIFYIQYFPWITNISNFGRAYPPRRIGIANWFGNIGGFWKIHDKLPGSFEDRILNDEELLQVIQEQVEQDDLGPDDLIEIEKNINLFNKVAAQYKGRYFRIFERRHRQLTTTGDAC